MVHPEDERYKHLIGKMVKLPLCDREIPIIADSYVDLGIRHRLRQGHAGAHDFNDYAVGPAPRPADDFDHLTLDAKDQRERPREISAASTASMARKAVVADLEAAF